MSDNNDPVVVNGNVLPAPIAAALRYALTLGLGWLVNNDVLPADQAEGIIALGIMAATIGYGLYKTYQTKKTQVAAAAAAPNTEFVVKK